MKHQITATSAETDDFLRMLAFFALRLRALTSQEDTPPLGSVKKEAEGWKAGAAKAAARFNIPAKTWGATVDAAWKQDNPKLPEKLLALRTLIRDNKTAVINDVREVTEQYQTALLDRFSTYFNSQSASALTAIEGNISALNSSSLSRAFRPQLADKKITGGQDDLLAEIKDAAKGMKPSVAGMFLSAPQAQALKEKSPARSDAYAAAYKQLSLLFRTALEAIVSTYKAPFAPIVEVDKKLRAMGLKFTLFPQGAIHPGIFVNAKGVVGVTEQGDAEKATGILNPRMDVEINPAFDFKEPLKPTNPYFLKWYFIDQPRKNPNSLRSAQRTKGLAEKRRVQVHELVNNIDVYKRKWRADLSDKDRDKRMFATILELAYLTSARLQAATGQSKDEKTFGVVSWQKRHIVKIAPKQLTLRFPAKAGKIQNPSLKVAEATDSRERTALTQAIANVTEFTKDRAATDPIFETTTGRTLTNLYSELRSYMSGIGIRSTPHKFRHARGTKIFIDLVKDSEFKPGAKTQAKPAEVRKFFNETLKKVGEALGHMAIDKEGNQKPTAMTAKRYYVDPEVMAAFLIGHNVPLDPVLRERLVKQGLDPSKAGKGEFDFKAMTTAPADAEDEAPAPPAKKTVVRAPAGAPAPRKAEKPAKKTAAPAKKIATKPAVVAPAVGVEDIAEELERLRVLIEEEEDPKQIKRLMKQMEELYSRMPNDDADEMEDEPAPRPAARRPAKEDDADVMEDEAPAPAKKAAPAKKPAAKPARKPVDDDLDEME